jgi:hypothetical protein
MAIDRLSILADPVKLGRHLRAAALDGHATSSARTATRSTSTRPRIHRVRSRLSALGTSSYVVLVRRV